MRESYSKKSIKPYWSEICQICRGKKIREIHLRSVAVTVTLLYSSFLGRVSRDYFIYLSVIINYDFDLRVFMFPKSIFPRLSLNTTILRGLSTITYYYNAVLHTVADPVRELLLACSSDEGKRGERGGRGGRGKCVLVFSAVFRTRNHRNLFTYCISGTGTVIKWNHKSSHRHWIISF